MFQNVSTKERASSAFSTATTVQPWSAQTDADKLMDDLFADIDRILEGSSKLPTEPIKPEYVSLQSIVMPKMAMPSPLVASQPATEESTPNATQETHQVKGVETPVANSETKQSGVSLDKILLALGLVSFGVTTTLVMVSQKRVILPFWQNFVAAPATQNEPLSGVDNEFAKYALRSLEAIERKNEGKQQTANVGVAGSQNNLSTLAIPGNRAPGASQPATVREIYYPYMVYQSPSLGGQRINSSIGTPLIPASPAPVLRPVLPSVSPSPQLAQPSVANTPKVGASVPRGTVAPTTPSVQRESVASPKPRVTPSVVATSAVTASPSPAIASPPSPPAIASPPSPSPSAVTALPSPPPPSPVNHTLVGVLEFGSQSAALFDIDGITQRIKIGEPIGTSGWILVDLKNDEAIIRRNGEVRSVYNGQKF